MKFQLNWKINKLPISTFSMVALFLSTYAFGQKIDNSNDLSVLAELRFRTMSEKNMKYIPVGPLNGTIPIKDFLKDFELRLNLDSYKMVFLKNEMRPKEVYYDKQEPGVEVKIIIPKSISSKLDTNGNYTLNGGFYEKVNEKVKIFDIKNFTLSFPKDEESPLYIDNNAFKLKDPIYIGSPEEFSVSIILNYLDRKLNDSSLGLNTTIKEIEYMDMDTLVSMELSTAKLLEYYRLLHFLEPFLNENSFLQKEAQLLQLKIAEPDSLTLKNLTFSKEVHKRYIKKYNYLNSCFVKVNNILFRKTNTIQTHSLKSPYSIFNNGYVFENGGFYVFGISYRLFTLGKQSIWIDAKSFQPLNSSMYLSERGPLIFSVPIKFNLLSKNEEFFSVYTGPSMIIDFLPGSQKNSLGIFLKYEIIPPFTFKLGNNFRIGPTFQYSLDYSFSNKNIFNGIYLGFQLKKSVRVEQ